jgi:hypothetical protein
MVAGMLSESVAGFDRNSHADRAAVMHTPIQTAKLNDVDPPRESHMDEGLRIRRNIHVG